MLRSSSFYSSVHSRCRARFSSPSSWTFPLKGSRRSRMLRYATRSRSLASIRRVILLIMTDDQGYGVSSTFGGVIETPALDRIAKAGLRYT